MITAKAAAKINLFLHVGERRDDGYHPLQSLAVFAEAGDALEFHPAEELSLSVQGPFARGLSDEGDNLILRAARALDAAARIVLTKNLPVASGIGGGSADAAATLRALGRGGDGRLLEIAASLGSDVPVCLLSRPAWMEGRGEILTPIAQLPRLPMLLVNPGVAVPTAAVFRALKERRGTGMAIPKAIDLAFLRATANDLETPALALQPVIADVLGEIDAQPGSLLARMSGSGATCFGLFDNAERMNAASRKIALAHPNWWVCPTRIA
ncbi:MAG TPA: 4-(cytidine 5'-diphospho)-2-C-methyl-D-erythritol kinase [Rhizomicrobium sp.]|nr:4-(cytidine 5'-diphospho)-2-C-methyl-D-erythritol kinase [Rhizomicrobium sp.]